MQTTDCCTIAANPNKHRWRTKSAVFSRPQLALFTVVLPSPLCDADAPGFAVTADLPAVIVILLQLKVLKSAPLDGTSRLPLRRRLLAVVLGQVGVLRCMMPRDNVYQGPQLLDLLEIQRVLTPKPP